jgi:Immunity protein 50
MSWHRLATNPEVIDALYGDAPPTLDGCYFSGMGLHEREGGSLRVGLWIKQMPETHNWPKDWWKESNKVLVGLSISGLSAVRIEGWRVWAVASVDLRRASDGRSVDLKLSGTWGYVAATGDSMNIRIAAGKSVAGPENPYDL